MEKIISTMVTRTPMRASEIVRKTGVLCSRGKINVRNGSQDNEEANTSLGLNVGLERIKEESVGN